MRYEVGQEIMAVAFVVPGRNPMGIMIPLLHDDVQPSKIFVKKLTVAEHRRVPNEWDPKEELRHDGFILKDEEGMVWHNQYPRASYGQLSDTQDRVFEYCLDGKSTDEITALINNEHEVPLFYEDMEESLARILRGIASVKVPQSKRAALELLLANTVAAAREKYPRFSWIQAPHEFKKQDGTIETHADILDTTITF